MAASPGRRHTTEDSQTTARDSSGEPEEPRESESSSKSKWSSEFEEEEGLELEELEAKLQYSTATTSSEHVYLLVVTPQAEESTVRPLK